MAKRYWKSGSIPLLIFLSCSAFGGSSRSTSDLFFYPDKLDPSDSFSNTPAMAYAPGLITVNVSALSNPDTLGPKATLPNGLQYDVFSETLEWRGENAFKWTGVFIGLDGETFDAILTYRDGMSAGIIFGEETEFQLQPLSAGYHRLVQLDPGTYSECGGSVLPDGLDRSPPLTAMEYEVTDIAYAADQDTVIDVLLVYTPEARAAAGGTEQIHLILENAIDFANQAYLNSTVGVEVNLVAAAENGYSESGKTSTEMLEEIRANAAFQSLRDEHGADVVALVTSTLESNIGGVGFLMTTYSLGSVFAPYAYSVNRLSNLHWTLTHEMGHNMGLNHEPESAGLEPSQATYPYAFGHKVEGVFRTIMSYACSEVSCPRIQYFSNSDITWEGMSIGISNERENSLTLSHTAAIVASFRERPSCSPPASPDELDYPSVSEAGEFTVTWSPGAPDVTQYTLQRSTSSSFSDAATAYSGSLTFFDEGELDPGSYYYRVRSESCGGFSSWVEGSIVVVAEAQELSSVEFSTSLVGNEAEQGEIFQLLGEASSGNPVTFDFFASSTSAKPGTAFHTSVKSNCSTGCEAVASFTAPSQNTSLYFWLDVYSGTATIQRSLTVQVVSEEEPPPPGPTADLHVSGPKSVQAQTGESFSYAITLTNRGPSDATGVSLTHAVPEGMNYVSSYPGDCSSQGRKVICSIGNLAQGRITNVEFLFEAFQEGIFIPAVSVSAAEPDPLPANNSASYQVKVSATANLVLSPQKTSLAVHPEQELQLEFQVTNAGPATSHNVEFSMTLPRGAQVNSTDPECKINSYLSCNFGSMEGGESETLQVKLSFNEEGTFDSVSNVVADETDPDRDDNEATVEFVVKRVNPLVFPYGLREGSNLFPEDLYAGVALFNPNTVPTDVEFTAYDELGRELDRVRLSEMDGRDLIPPKGQTALLPTEIFDMEAISAVFAEGIPHSIQLFFMLGDYNLNTLDGVASPLPEGPILYFPVARSNNNESVVLFLFNTSSGESRGVSFQLYDGGEGPVAEAHRSLPAQGSLVETVDQMFGFGSTDGYIKVVADGSVKGFELYSQGRGFSALAAQSPDKGTRLIAPHFFASLDGDTELRLQNIGETSANVVIGGFADNGTPIGKYSIQLPEGGCLVSKVTELLPIEPDTAKVVSGYLIIDISGSFLSTPTLTGAVTFTGFDGNTIATLPLVAGGNLQTRFLHVAHSDELNMFTGLAVLNPGEEAANVTISIYNQAGELVAEKALNDLPPNTRVVDILSGPAFFPSNFQQVGGHIEAVSDSPVVIFSLFGNYGGSFLSAIQGLNF